MRLVSSHFRRFSRPLPRVGLLAAAFILIIAGCTTGYQGQVRERELNGSIGSTVPGAALRFLPEGGGSAATTVSDASGQYRIGLGAGRYVVTVSHPAYQDYASAPGFFVVTGSDGYQTGNVFLHPTTTTTVLLVRHADRADGADALAVPEGVERAAELARVADRAGVAAIYSTAFDRTRDTAEPLAETLDLPVTPYSSPAALAATIAADHAGDTVLVVGHSNTQKPIIEALLDQDLYAADPFVEDFDNLFVVARDTSGAGSSVINLQYGADTTPDLNGLSRDGLTTVLLVRTAESRSGLLTTAGQDRAEALVHVAAKAGVDAIRVPSGNAAAAATAAPVAASLGLSATTYDGADPAATVASVAGAHGGDTVLMVADHPVLGPLFQAFGARPFPTSRSSEYDQLVVLFVAGAGDARTVSLQYGPESP